MCGIASDQLNSNEKYNQAKGLISTESKQPRNMSIEDKINMIRDKIKKDELKSPIVKRNNWFEHKSSGKKGLKV
jgi:hypothetical protein